MLQKPVLTLAQLEAYDPQSPSRSGERRFLCPLCGDDKPKDAGHRSLSLKVESGLWNCHRCQSGGRLRENWEKRPMQSRRERANIELERTFGLSIQAKMPTQTDSDDWLQHRRNLRELVGSPGFAYLTKRGVPLQLALDAGVQFSSNWVGRPAVVFPISDAKGNMVASQGRYTDGRSDPKARSVGSIKEGVFWTPGVWQSPAILITEAPIDALSLAVAGYPAIALCGKSSPQWLPMKFGFRRVLLALDADKSGDEVAFKLEAVFLSFGARCERLRPEGFKDWNEMLVGDSQKGIQGVGRDALSDFLAQFVLTLD